MRTLTKETRMAERQGFINCFKAIVTEYKEEECVVAIYGRGENSQGVMIFDGTAGKPSKHFTFKNEERMQEFIVEHLKSKRSILAWKAERKIKNKGSLTGSAATAKAIRERLKREFPGVKFSVTSDNFAGGNSVDISWVDGPVTSLVERITNQYQKGYFDGMTDYYNYREISGDLRCPGAKYVHCSREQSEERKEELEAHCLQQSGQNIEKFLGYNRGPWAYENQYPEKWAQKYLEMYEANKAADEGYYATEREKQIAECEADNKVMVSNKVISLADYRKETVLH